MRAYILCGGLGTRLREVTKGGQKAMVDVDGEPFLLLLLRELEAAGIRDIVFCAGYRADQLAQWLDNLAESSELQLHMVVEETPLGTGGALLHALSNMPANQAFMVLNADTYLGADAFAAMRSGTGNRILAARVSDRRRYGSLQVASDSTVQALTEKGAEGAGVVNAGVYCFEPDAFVGVVVKVCSLERDLLPLLISRQQLYAVDYAGTFQDIGTPSALADFRHQRYSEGSQ